MHEECGVFGVWSPLKRAVPREVYLGLYALQHRGQESCGIAVSRDGVFHHYKGDGLVGEVFNKERLDRLGEGNIAVGHVRYSTTGGKNHNNIQPIVISHMKGNMALCHNENLVNARSLRARHELSGRIFHGTSDTETIVYTIVAERLKVSATEEAVFRTMQQLQGAYSCALMTAAKLMRSARIPWPICPWRQPTALPANRAVPSATAVLPAGIPSKSPRTRARAVSSSPSLRRNKKSGNRCSPFLHPIYFSTAANSFCFAAFAFFVQVIASNP